MKKIHESSRRDHRVISVEEGGAEESNADEQHGAAMLVVEPHQRYDPDDGRQQGGDGFHQCVEFDAAAPIREGGQVGIQ